MKKLLTTIVAGIGATASYADCELLSAADAEEVLGPSVMDLSGDNSDSQCLFIGGSPQGTFTVQFADRAWYEQTSILPPHTPIDVGDEGRSNVDTNGVTAVQFVRGDTTVTMSVRPSSPSDRDYLDALVAVAARLEDRLE